MPRPSSGTAQVRAASGGAIGLPRVMTVTLARVGNQPGLIKRDHPVIVFSDSQYVAKGISEWLPNWKARGWRTAAKKPVKNADLWKRLDKVASKYDVEWRWVRGHAGHPGNEKAHQLASREAEKAAAL